MSKITFEEAKQQAIAKWELIAKDPLLNSLREPDCSFCSLFSGDRGCGLCPLDPGGKGYCCYEYNQWLHCTFKYEEKGAQEMAEKLLRKIKDCKDPEEEE